MPDDAPKPPEIDEGHFREWVKFGFAEMTLFMVKHAQFDAYLRRHHREEENTDAS